MIQISFVNGCFLISSGENQTIFLAPASGFYTMKGYGKDEVRIAYVLNKKDLAVSLKILEEALKVYPGRKE